MRGLWLMMLAGFALSLIGASEAGFRLGRRALPEGPGKSRPPLGAIESGVLALLGLLLGFTLSMAVARFEVRKRLVLEEASAIGTAYFRTELIPDPQATEIAGLLREYLVIRLQYAEVRDLVRLRGARELVLRLQRECWEKAVAYGVTDPNPVKAGLLLQALNEVIELEEARWMALQNEVPPAVVYANGIVALCAAILAGYAFGLEGRRQVFAISILTLVITVVLGVIVDLDRSRQGFMQVSQQPLIDLQQQVSTSK